LLTFRTAGVGATFCIRPCITANSLGVGDGLSSIDCSIPAMSLLVRYKAFFLPMTSSVGARAMLVLVSAFSSGETV